MTHFLFFAGVQQELAIIGGVTDLSTGETMFCEFEQAVSGTKESLNAFKTTVKGVCQRFFNRTRTATGSGINVAVNSNDLVAKYNQLVSVVNQLTTNAQALNNGSINISSGGSINISCLTVTN